MRFFLRGMIDFRSAFTERFDEVDDMHRYDLGREWAHRLTLRWWDA